MNSTLVNVLAISIVAVVTTFESTSATPLSEADRTNFIGGAVKTCKETIKNKNTERLWSQTDMSNYCSCYSVTMSNNVTQEEVDYASKHDEGLSRDLIDRVVKPAAA